MSYPSNPAPGEPSGPQKTTQTTPVPKHSVIRRVGASARRLLLGAVSILIVWVLLEGASSTLLFIWDFEQNAPDPMAEGIHTRYDELLGWVNIENVTIEDLYGDGIHLRTNSRGFRAKRDYDVTPPAGIQRIICSGDSFTLGYGVDNDQTWCELLTRIDRRLETVNMGQGGYGIDQAYLWYQRDGTLIGHDIHLFSFINTDFQRMRQRSFHGYGKPLLGLQNGELVVQNLPVPRALFAPWIARNLPILNRLRFVQLLRAVLPAESMQEPPSPAESREVLMKIIEELEATNRSKKSLLVVVFLPTQSDYSSDESRNLRHFLRRELKKRELAFVDLVQEIRKLPPWKVGPLFIPVDSVIHRSAYAGGHYSIEGNDYIARVLYKALLAIPEFSSRFTDETSGG